MRDLCFQGNEDIIWIHTLDDFTLGLLTVYQADELLLPCS